MLDSTEGTTICKNKRKLSLGCYVQMGKVLVCRYAPPTSPFKRTISIGYLHLFLTKCYKRFYLNGYNYDNIKWHRALSINRRRTLCCAISLYSSDTKTNKWASFLDSRGNVASFVKLNRFWAKYYCPYDEISRTAMPDRTDKGAKRWSWIISIENWRIRQNGVTT